ncbi:MAG: DUF488 domain-containing protein [Hyphomicrobium sp.]
MVVKPVASIAMREKKPKSENKTGATAHASRARVAIKRAYEPAQPDDGLRVLVDRLWPRGLRKDHARVDLWAKEIAPSSELRRWFGHSPDRWEEFKKKYRTELFDNMAQLNPIREALERGCSVTLLFAAHDVAHNNAVVLKGVLEDGDLPRAGLSG